MENKFAILILALLVFSLVPTFVSADIGPKPSADIHITLNGQNVPDASFNAKTLTCNYQMKYEQIITELAPYEDSDNWYDKCQGVALKYGFDEEICYRDLQNQRGMANLSKHARCGDDKLCEKLIQKIPDNSRGCYWAIAPFAWGGNCQNSNCHFNYFLPSELEFRLAVYLPSQDKVYLSAEVTRENFRSAFEANLLSDGTISIQETTPFIQSNSARNIKTFLLALILTLILEIIVALIFLSVTKISKKVLISILIANIISLPIVWFVFPLLKIIPLAILLGEIFAFVFESYFIHLLNKDIISLKKSFVLSILMNLASLVIGGFIFLFLLMMFYL